ncbi:MULTISPECIES: ROK family protein [Phytobacter]|uniref:Fructokinase n=1 Tax=Phytobacter diazotrophicus TaxID=395631 RepID=A0ABM7VNQ8_9ENTR|nr:MULTISPECIES: ROK family protein [Phytobacter]MDU4152440.1 ROK family protein [Enterobacteriaceae bacterium]MDU7378291.1 ROK family protein [Enterobacteriaceae bacterium]BBE75041.1 fructokinase [Phytobacter sp. MRY16-398]BDD48614.1 fructokinase [Phytobacter diazotrophicus]BEG79646.1 ROK family protein [Phytobacter diazotrophicus]
MYYLGLDIGGTKIAAVVMDAQGQEKARYRCPTQKASYPQFVESVVAFIDQIRHDMQQPMMTGIALPGSVSPLSGLIKNSNIQVINGRALQADLQQLLGQTVVMANDGNCFALSEACDGAGQRHEVVFGITLGTGCGGGIAIHRQPFVGAWGNAAECGHITLPGYREQHDGPPVRCYCGKDNCVESFVSGTGLSERYRLFSGQHLTGDAIVALAQQGETNAVRQVTRFRQQLARTLATVVNLLDPGVIVIGGGLSNAEPLIANLEADVAPFVFTDHFSTPIVKAHHGDSSGMRGAAWLAIRTGRIE